MFGRTPRRSDSADDPSRGGLQDALRNLRPPARRPAPASDELFDPGHGKAAYGERQGGRRGYISREISYAEDRSRPRLRSGPESDLGRTRWWTAPLPARPGECSRTCTRRRPFGRLPEHRLDPACSSEPSRISGGRTRRASPVVLENLTAVTAGRTWPRVQGRSFTTRGREYRDQSTSIPAG